MAATCVGLDGGMRRNLGGVYCSLNDSNGVELCWQCVIRYQSIVFFSSQCAPCRAPHAQWDIITSQVIIVLAQKFVSDSRREMY